MNNIKNKFSSCAKLGAGLSLAVALLTLQGCVSMVKLVSANQGAVEDRVFRVKVAEGFNLFDKDGYEASDTGRTLFKSQLTFKVYGGESTAEQTVPYRVTRVSAGGTWEWVTVFNNGPASGNALAFVNDDVPLLKDGDMVDVYAHKKAEVSLKDRRFWTVIRLVCIAEDKACLKREKTGHRRSYGWIVQPEGQFDASKLKVSPQMDLSGHWLPGKEPIRPAVPEGATVEVTKNSGWGE